MMSSELNWFKLNIFHYQRLQIYHILICRLNKSVYERHISRTVLMVIDAMRTDFIQNQQNTSMKYLNKLMDDGVACSLNLNVEVPTVTMPRIKVNTLNLRSTFVSNIFIDLFDF